MEGIKPNQGSVSEVLELQRHATERIPKASRCTMDSRGTNPTPTSVLSG